MGAFWRALGAFIGGTLKGGPMMGAAMAAAQISKDIFGWRGTHIDVALGEWTERYIGPHFRELLLWSQNITSLTPNNLRQFNSRFAELYAYKAYWEYISLKSNGDALLLAQAKAQALGEYIEVLETSLNDYFPTATYGYSFYPVNFDATIYGVIANETLFWQGAKTVVAEKLVFADEQPDDEVNTGGGGSTQTGGGGTTQTGGGGSTLGTGGTIKTGGGTTQTGGGSTQTGGGTTQTGGGGSTLGTGGTIKTGGGTTQTGGGSTQTGGGTTTGDGSVFTPGIIPGGGTITTPDPDIMPGDGTTQSSGGSTQTIPEPADGTPAAKIKSNKLFTYLGIAAIGYLVLKK